MIEMYKGIANSPETELSEGISAQATIIKVNNIHAFPEGPNLATIGTDENAETIKYATKTANALSGCQRGIEGTARTWQTGEKIARNFTQKDHADLIANVNEVNENKLGKTEKAADSDKLDGQDRTYFATSQKAKSLETQIEQLRADIQNLTQQLNNKANQWMLTAIHLPSINPSWLTGAGLIESQVIWGRTESVMQNIGGVPIYGQNGQPTQISVGTHALTYSKAEQKFYLIV